MVTGKCPRGPLFNRPFHLLVDARSIGPTPTGVGNSLYRLLQGLHHCLQTEPELTISVIITPQSKRKASAINWKQLDQFQLIEESTQPSQHPKGDLFQQVRLPRMASRLKAQAIYSPAYLAPLFAGQTASFLMIHDDLIWSQPWSYPLSFRLYLSVMTRLSARSADKIFFPTNDARKRCCKRLGIPKRKTAVLYHGIESVQNQPITPLEQRKPYVLCVANAEERKNHEVLIRAMEGLQEGEVRFAGISPKATERIKSLSQLPGFQRCRILPPLSPEQLAAQYANASALVLPSRGEGFGQPIIEAMNSGTPLILSDIPVFHEIARSSAVYLSSDDIAGWRREIVGAIDHCPQFLSKVESGLEIGAKFTVRKSAETFLKTIKYTVCG